ncbi:MAG: DUF4870 domain-containing protein [Sandaracinaceae bacterium]
MSSPAIIDDFGTTAAPSQDEKTLAALGHGLTFFEGGLFGPLILYFVKREESEFVAFHSLQSLLFGLLFWGLTVVSCGLLGVLLVIPYMVFEGIATVKAYEGEYYELPLVGPYCREKHPRR